MKSIPKIFTIILAFRFNTWTMMFSPVIESFLVNFKNECWLYSEIWFFLACKTLDKFEMVFFWFAFSRNYFWTTFLILYLHHHRVFMDCPIEYRPPSSRDDGSQCHVFCKNLCQRYTSRPRTTSNITKWEEIDFLEIQ